MYEVGDFGGSGKKKTGEEMTRRRRVQMGR